MTWQTHQPGSPNEDGDAAELKRLIHPPAGGAVATRRQREVGSLDDVERVFVLCLIALMTVMKMPTWCTCEMMQYIECHIESLAFRSKPLWLGQNWHDDACRYREGTPCKS